MNILVANISVWYINNNNNKNITKQTLIMHISDMQFIIMSNNSIRPIIWIKNPVFIKNDDENIIVLDKTKNIEYNIFIHEIFEDISIWNVISSISMWISRKEENMKENVINQFDVYFPECKILQTEYVTPYWNIDILAINKIWVYQVIELKKRSTDFNTIDQVVKYWKYFEESWKDFDLYVIWIKNNNKNNNYAIDSWVTVIEE